MGRLTGTYMVNRADGNKRKGTRELGVSDSRLKEKSGASYP